MKTSPKILRWFGWVAGILFVMFILVYFGPGYYIYDMFTVTHPRCESVYMDGRRDFTPASFKGVYDYPEDFVDTTPYLMPTYETVEFPAREDGNTTSGWFIPSSTPSDKVVIVVHGGDVCRKNTSVLLPAGMLANNGFNVLMIDLRNHGDSQVTTGRSAAGAEEYKDVLGAFDWLITQGYAPEHIGLMGVSMGAATSINAFGQEPRIAALWEDSAYADIPTVLENQLNMNGIPTFFGNAVLVVAQFNGADLNAVSPIREIAKANGRPLAITHGVKDDWVNVNSAYKLYEASGKTAELWILDDTRHVEAMFFYPEEYQKRMIAFFEKALGK